MGIEQYVIDPDREYGNIAKELNGTIVKLRCHIRNFYKYTGYKARINRR